MKITSQKMALGLLMVIVSLLYGLPHIILSIKNGNNYTNLVLDSNTRFSRDETYAYAPFVNYILKGNFPLKDAYVKEYEYSPTPFIGETLPSAIYALLAKISGSLSRSFLIADFIFPPIIFLLLFLITKIYVINTYYCMAAAFLATIMRDFIAVIPYPKITFDYLLGKENNNFFLYLSRAFHPQFTYIIFLLAIYAFILVINNPKHLKYQILLALFFGLLFYSYIFYWTYFLFFSILVFIFLVLKKEWRILKALAMPYAIAFFIGSYYLFNIYSFTKLPLYNDFVTKSSAHSYPFVITSLRHFFLSLAFLFFYKKRNLSSFTLFILLLSGVLIGPISKLFLRQDLETLHYLRRALMPLSTIVLFIILYEFIKKGTKSVKVVIVLILALSIAYGLNIQISTSTKNVQSYSKDYQKEALFYWLRTNTEEDDVVGTLNTELNLLLPVYTKNKVFFAPTDRTITPTNEGVERYILLSNLLGISKNKQKEKLNSRNLNSYLFIYQAYNEDNNLIIDSHRRYYAEAKIDEFDVNKFKETLKKYDLDYVIVAPQDINDIGSVLSIKPIATINGFIIFKLTDTVMSQGTSFRL